MSACLVAHPSGALVTISVHPPYYPSSSLLSVFVYLSVCLYLSASAPLCLFNNDSPVVCASAAVVRTGVGICRSSVSASLTMALFGELTLPHRHGSLVSYLNLCRGKKYHMIKRLPFVICVHLRRSSAHPTGHGKNCFFTANGLAF